MSTRTQRINLLVSPEEKKAIEAAAIASQLSMSEHIRLAALEYDMSPSELEEVKYLVKEIGEVTERIHNKLKSHRAKMDALSAEFRALKEGK